MATENTRYGERTNQGLNERDLLSPDQPSNLYSPPAHIPAACVPRREYIYPHRSVHCFPISRARLFAALGIALVMSAATFYFGSILVGAHSELTDAILRLTGIGIVGQSAAEIFPYLGSVIAPDIPFPHHRTSPVRTALFLAASVFVLVVIHRKVPLSRNFVVFLLILLGISAVVVVFNPSFYFYSSMFEQIWLRGEILIWILLPWVSAFLFLLTLPSFARGVAWALFLQTYAMIWSAFRLAFCLGLLHYTGILFLPVLWFCLGFLSDLVYILVFYSLALRSSIRQTSGERRS